MEGYRVLWRHLFPKGHTELSQRLIEAPLFPLAIKSTNPIWHFLFEVFQRRAAERIAVTEEIAGLVERVTYFNEESGYSVLRVKVRGHPGISRKHLQLIYP